ncbi:hypothetical protein HV819_07835 [Anaerococcus sp. AGMB00486]|uniref:Uncharacterized protein n=1 Tax=Anaerococcus faecalis TaxID=2742993 RepID=A0ABX2NAZ5_9FIRM|nr:DUF859 family phage minor structural protein [Anaerococcus faecalis]NVF11887.1 hypothetical protein [Anaerococcus faecalis]
MATYSKTINNGTGTIHLEIRQQSQNIANNTSTVYYNLYIQGVGGYGFWNNYHTGKTSVVINGSTVHNQTGRDFDLRGGGSQQLASGTTTVKHNEDGSKSFSFSASLWSTSATGYVSGNFSLSKIPRASSFSLQNSSGTNITSIYAGNDVKIAIDKKVSSFTHTVKVSYSGNSETIVDKTSSNSVNWSNSTNVMTNYMKNLKNMNLTFTLETYDGNTRIGTSSKNLTLNVPSSAGPSINSVDITEANQNKINIIGSSPFYQHLTDLRIKTNGSGKYGASIKSVNVSIGPYNVSGQDAIIKDINLTGSQSVKITVNDSRDMSASTTRTINLNPYNLPNISFFNAYRDSANSRLGKARLSLESTVIDNKNPLSVVVELTEKGSNSWKTVYSATVGNGRFNDEINLGASLDDFKAYDVRARISDKFKSHMALSVVPASPQSLVIGASKPVVGIGKVPEIDKGLEVDGIIKVDGDGEKKAEFCGDFGSRLDFIIKGVRTNWFGTWGKDLFFSGNVNFMNNIAIKEKIVPYNSSQNKPFDVSLNGLSGYIKATRDPLGHVHLWGKVKISGANPTNRWSVWGSVPASWGPKVMLPILAQNGGYVIVGLGITSGGGITWIGQKGNSYSPSVGDSFEIDMIYRAGDADW